MSSSVQLSERLHGSPAARDELAGWIGGLGFTFLLFLGMAKVEHVGADAPPPAIEDLRMVSIPLEPPPPPPRVAEPAPADLPSLAGIELAASDSAVRVAVVPPDLETLVRPPVLPPRAVVPFARLHTEFKPRVDVEADIRHVYRESEVDKVPVALVRVAPPIPSRLFGDARSLRVVMLLVIEPSGRVSSARVSQSSGNAEFDAIFAQTVRESWEFTPALRKGKRVRCLATQPFRANLGGGSPYELP